MTLFWDGLSTSARAVLVSGFLLVLALFALAGWWLLHGDYDVLFADLRPQDAALMTAELDKLKQPYQLSDDGRAILVDKKAVPSTRLKLMGRELPLQGAVGLELFNNADFGMTEFAEKINYQRALQGELTRTIVSLSEIREARVHLAFAEQGLLKQNSIRPKAAVTVSMKAGQALAPAQIAGIQRLVAAAISGMTVDDVTIVDQRGVALTRANDNHGDGGPVASNRLELKRETEDYLSRKAGAVLERALGPGQALASVDVSLNMDQMRVTTEDILPAAAGVAGVVVRERETLGGPGATADPRQTEGSRSAVRQRETDYHAGKRVEHIVSQPGSIRRIQVLAVVRAELDSTGREQVRALISAAVGAVPERGDVVLVESFGTGRAQASALETAGSESGLAGVSSNSKGQATSGTAHGVGSSRASASSPSSAGAGSQALRNAGMVMLAIVVAFIAWMMMTVRRRESGARHEGGRKQTSAAGTGTAKHAGAGGAGGAGGRLDPAQREQALQQLKSWLEDDGESTPGATAGGAMGGAGGRNAGGVTAASAGSSGAATAIAGAAGGAKHDVASSANNARNAGSAGNAAFSKKSGATTQGTPPGTPAGIASGLRSGA